VRIPIGWLISAAAAGLYSFTGHLFAEPANTRFYPNCCITVQAIYKHGAVKGSLMAAWRILRCNPFNRGGYDPVP
jgi:putative membrane protein insertion efficiency factor